MDEKNRRPESTIAATLHVFETAEVVAQFAPEVGKELAANAATDYEGAAGNLLYDQLALLGFSDEQMESLSEKDLLELVPEIMAQVRTELRNVGAIGASALSDQAYQTERSLGRTRND